MTREIFLARTEEQEKFKQVLQTRHKTLWQVLQTPLFTKSSAENNLPFVMLFYGEGGIGKTRLVRHLRQITEQEPYTGKFNTLFLDWEYEQSRNIDLQVGHENIHAETVLRVLHDALSDKGWANCFDDYRKLVKQLRNAEAKVDEELKKAKPDAEVQTQVRKWGAKGVAWMIRRAPGADILPSQTLEPVLETAIQVSAEGLSQVRQFVQAALTPEEYEIYAQPQERLAEALGKGIAELAKRKPLVIFLDTYEIVDRPECDYTLRATIRHSGQQVVWVIAGRANLADSGQRAKLYFRGYKRDFPEEQVYAKSLSEFGDKEIQAYFTQLIPERPLSAEEVETIARFTLGIPFVNSQVAAMWKEGKPLAEIVAPVHSVLGETTLRQQVVKETSERFLVHCFGAKERERDLQAVYALAIMRRPDVKLLKEMLDVKDLEQELQFLRERYSFIWVEQMRLDEKLTQFLREYLLAPVRRVDPIVQQLNERAIAWLELQLEEMTRDISDTAEQLREENIVEVIADLAHHKFWQEEEKGWRYLVPKAVEGSQYNRAFTRSLLEVAEVFSSTFSKDGSRRLQMLSGALQSFPNPEDFRQTLEELEKLAQHKWFAGKNEAEHKAILLLEKGRLCYRQEKYKEALQAYLEVEKQLPEYAGQLRKNLAEEFYILSGEFIWSKGSRNPVYSAEGEQAIEKAIALNENEAKYYYYLGVVQGETEHYKLAIANFEKAIQLDPKDANSHNGLGTVYQDQGNYELAISAYQTAIELDPKDAAPHNNLGNVYQFQGNYELAISAYQTAIKLDPKFAATYYNLGSLYSDQGNYELAISVYQTAIELDPKDAAPHNNLGSLYSDQGNYELAISACQKAIELDPKDAEPHNGIGWIYLLKNDFIQAKDKFEEAINLDPKEYTYLLNLGLAYALQKNVEEAKNQWQKGLTILQGNNVWDTAIRALYTVAVGQTEQGISEMQQIINENRSAVEALRNALEDAEILARCPVKLEGIDIAFSNSVCYSNSHE